MVQELRATALAACRPRDGGDSADGENAAAKQEAASQWSVWNISRNSFVARITSPWQLLLSIWKAVMEHLEDQDHCSALIQPLLLPFHAGWHDAYAKYLSYPTALTADHDDTAAANNVRCHMWAWLLNNLVDVAGVSILKAGHTRQLGVLNYRDQAVIRFKKVDASGRHANFETDQQDDFDRERPLPHLPTAAVRLTCGYEPSPAGEAIRRIIIARVFDKTVLWAAQINVLDDIAFCEDITPARFAGTSSIQERPRRTGER